ncbi:MAG TPA: ZIP family metal transporter [Bacteroidia bacterium]|nr:ZIP family metal transporter [Bacteroidia bacterium]HRH09351.1 ZIP family metal transporter [Bacteroidia bacterium]HRH63968.1 ZIP family metal transporter [Bacteroidia bacterium]
MSLITTSLLFFTALLSGWSAFLFERKNKHVLKLLLAFSGAYLFAICVLHLIPEIYMSGNSEIGIYILTGFFLQIFLEFFSEGIEHGHVHVHASSEHNFPIAIMLSLCIHSFLEGMPLAKLDSGSYHSLLVGIILHNIPVALALTTMMIESNVARKSIFTMLVIFAAMAPLGAYCSQAISTNLFNNISVYFDKIIAVVIGIFLHISTTILFESSENHRFNLLKFATILVGALTAWLFHF